MRLTVLAISWLVSSTLFTQKVPDIPIDRAPPASFVYEPSLAVAEDTLYGAWVYGAAGGGNAYLNWSTDGGATWQAIDLRINQSNDGRASGASIATADGLLCLFYSVDSAASRNGQPLQHACQSQPPGQRASRHRNGGHPTG
ncbi:MAG: hypothetical protein AAF628_15955 [Planctomycetota bacterium]